MSRIGCFRHVKASCGELFPLRVSKSRAREPIPGALVGFPVHVLVGFNPLSQARAAPLRRKIFSLQYILVLFFCYFFYHLALSGMGGPDRYRPMEAEVSAAKVASGGPSFWPVWEPVPGDQAARLSADPALVY